MQFMLKQSIRDRDFKQKEKVQAKEAVITSF